jgi:hypothetical protein
VLLWAGVAVVPVAVALLAFGESAGVLRAAAALTAVAVLLVAAGAVLGRGHGDADARGLVAEVAALRAELRADIADAARAMQRSVADEMVALIDVIEALRGQIDLLRASAEQDRPAALVPAPPAADQVPSTHRASRHAVGAGMVHPPREESWTEQMLRRRLAHHGDWRSALESDPARSTAPGSQALPTEPADRSGFAEPSGWASSWSGGEEQIGARRDDRDQPPGWDAGDLGRRRARHERAEDL